MTTQTVPLPASDLKPGRRHEEHVYLSIKGQTASIIRAHRFSAVHFDLDLDPQFDKHQQTLLTGISRCRSGSQIRIHTLDPDLTRLVRDKDALDPEIARTLSRKDQLLTLARREREVPLWGDLLASLQRGELPAPPPSADHLLYTASFTDHTDTYGGAILVGHGSFTVKSLTLAGTDDVIQAEIDLTHWAMTQMGVHATAELHPGHASAVRLWDRPETLLGNDYHLHGERMRDIGRLIQKMQLRYTVRPDAHPLLSKHARAAAATGYASGDVL